MLGHIILFCIEIFRSTTAAYISLWVNLVVGQAGFPKGFRDESCEYYVERDLSVQKPRDVEHLIASRHGRNFQLANSHVHIFLKGC